MDKDIFIVNGKYVTEGDMLVSDIGQTVVVYAHGQEYWYSCVENFIESEIAISFTFIPVKASSLNQGRVIRVKAKFIKQNIEGYTYSKLEKSA